MAVQGQQGQLRWLLAARPVSHRACHPAAARACAANPCMSIKPARGLPGELHWQQARFGDATGGERETLQAKSRWQRKMWKVPKAGRALPGAKGRSACRAAEIPLRKQRKQRRRPPQWQAGCISSERFSYKGRVCVVRRCVVGGRGGGSPCCRCPISPLGLRGTCPQGEAPAHSWC